MTLLKMHQHHIHKYIFKLIYNHGYLYTADTFGIGNYSSNSNLLGYVEVPKGYKHETVKNI